MPLLIDGRPRIGRKVIWPVAFAEGRDSGMTFIPARPLNMNNIVIFATLSRVAFVGGE